MFAKSKVVAGYFKGVSRLLRSVPGMFKKIHFNQTKATLNNYLFYGAKNLY